MKYLVINADDFGNYSSVDEGIIFGIKSGVITSTSVMVNRKHAEDVGKLINFPQISIGLHFELPKDETSMVDEFNKQLEKFDNLVGRKPDHLDSHKIRPKDISELAGVFQDYTQKYRTPIRDWGHANFIDQFFGLDKITPQGLIDALSKNLSEGYNELMTHAGYVDEEVLISSGYSKPREIELNSLLSSEFREYLKKHEDIQLVSWKEVKI